MDVSETQQNGYSKITDSSKRGPMKKDSSSENQHIEWKVSWRNEYIKWICGFANAQGGTLVIGKNDKGNIAGIRDAKKLLEEIPNKVRDLLGIIVEVNLNTNKGKDFLEILVEPYPHPVSYKGEYHYRTGSTKQILKGPALDAFLLKKYGLHWDGTPIPQLSPDHLETKSFTLFTQKAVQSKRLGDGILEESRDSLLKKLHLFEGSYLKRASVLLFHEDPEEFVTGAFIKIGFFRNDADLLYQDEIHGNLFKQIDKTLDLLLTKYMKAYIDYEGIQRVEQYLFPVPALREALLNAVVHKDYASGNPVQISVYENKIIIWNPGRLPEELTLDMLQQKHPSIPYNPLIAAAFFRAGYIEAWGRGIEKINHECDAAGVQKPDYNYEFAGLMITFKRDIEEKSPVKGSPISSPISSPKTEVKIIELMKDKPEISAATIGETLGISKRAVLKHTKKLQEKGILKRIGPARGGHWEVAENGKN